MPQITRHELHTSQRTSLRAIAGIPILPAERDGILPHPNHSRIADGRARHVVSQILQRAGSIARGLDVHTPVLAPDVRIDLPFVALKKLPQMLSEGRLQQWQVEQELGILDAYEATTLAQTGAGYQAVNMRMEPQYLVPGVQHRREAVDVGPKPLGGRQLLREGAGDRSEEQIISLLGEGSPKAGTQLSREGKRDQEVGSIHEFLQLALNPLGGGGPPALRAGLVIAGVPREVSLFAARARKGLPTHSLRAAIGNRPDGAALIPGQRRRRLLELRQEPTQRPKYRGRNGHETSAWQVAAECIHQLQRIAGGLMRQVQIDHGGGDLLVSEQLLDRVQMGPGFQQMSREAMAQSIPILLMN